MQFRTQIPIPKSNQPIDYNSQVVSLGSCFAVNMGEKLNYFKFRNTINPFGILFHPLAIEKFIGYALQQKQFTETDIFYHNERWHCYAAHSDLSNPDKNKLIDNLNTAVTNTGKALHEATHLIITLGTAWVYRHNQSGNVVANCHKVPQKEFSKELLSVTTIVQSLQNSMAMLREVNPNLQFIFTVSPVRHIKDGFTENQWSKANLISALHEVLAITPSGAGGLYFPSYEIMMDELRDYRFYASDMIHPNNVAIDYIWERFTESCIAPEAYNTMKEVDAIQKGLQHRPFNVDSEEHKAFLEKLNQRADKLKEQYPHINFR
ncbi:GSCFA domain-containing protein [Flavobacterium salilacus subsp. salilacus]|uniref:GSCFA domain-containing protein n=1 Tax=Flavobacterium TaxID=237 RepID=UPI0010752C62|nr:MULTISPECIES: GSCFA domain-containing protein [Flavobacterium]KAF2519601.1 GSCFA domain-containing protein [Flavobacterium salilacus subsp. salilacus]MBE1614497.1 GSCFA domain-containing protein [Flavobacterium sp. SaA2.13]